MIGQTISHYRVLEKIGEGGMSRVHFAWITRLNRTVAIKVQLGKSFDNPETEEPFQREARSARALYHLCISAILEC